MIYLILKNDLDTEAKTTNKTVKQDRNDPDFKIYITTDR